MIPSQWHGFGSLSGETLVRLQDTSVVFHHPDGHNETRLGHVLGLMKCFRWTFSVPTICIMWCRMSIVSGALGLLRVRNMGFLPHWLAHHQMLPCCCWDDNVSHFWYRMSYVINATLEIMWQLSRLPCQKSQHLGNERYFYPLCPGDTLDEFAFDLPWSFPLAYSNNCLDHELKHCGNNLEPWFLMLGILVMSNFCGTDKVVHTDENGIYLCPYNLDSLSISVESFLSSALFFLWLAVFFFLLVGLGDSFVFTTAHISIVAVLKEFLKLEDVSLYHPKLFSVFDAVRFRLSKDHLFTKLGFIG